MNLKSSWLLDPFMVKDWEKLRKEQGEFRTPRAWVRPGARGPPSGPGPVAPPPPGPRGAASPSTGDSPALGELGDLLVGAGVAVLLGEEG